MKLIKGDLFEQNTQVACITTNGFIKNNGHAVMGKGCAKEYLGYNPNAEKQLGAMLSKYGNVPNFIERHDDTAVWSFPVKHKAGIICKPTEVHESLRDTLIFITRDDIVKHMQSSFNYGDYVPGWALKAEPQLIMQSANILVDLANKHQWDKVVLPRPGCGAGELKWDAIHDILDSIFDDRFHIISR